MWGLVENVHEYCPMINKPCSGPGGSGEVWRCRARERLHRDQLKRSTRMSEGMAHRGRKRVPQRINCC